VARAWAKERRAWADRPHLWKLCLLLTVNLGVQGALAFMRGDRWFTALCVVGIAVGAALTTLTYSASRGR
jgi:hypothetical protein